MLDLDNLKTEGVVIVENISSQEELISLARFVGKIRPHPNGENMATLKSSDGANSLAGTFSKAYGLSAFPLHTDTAFWGLPARYIVMGMLTPSRSTTNYVPLSEIHRLISGDLLKQARRAIYLVETFEGSKYTSLVFDAGESCGIRFDPNIMTPVNGYAKRIHEELIIAMNRLKLRKIDWDGNKAVVIDNWNVLHSRSAVNNENREMLRIYLES